MGAPTLLPTIREGPLRDFDFFSFLEEPFTSSDVLSQTEKKTFAKYAVEVSQIARSLDEETLAYDFEQSIRVWLDIIKTVLSFERILSKTISEVDRWDKQCDLFEEMPTAKTVMTLVKVYLSEVDKSKYDAYKGENALYRRYKDSIDDMDKILEIYKQKRTKIQLVKNTMGGIESKVVFLRKILDKMYKVLLQVLLRILSLSTCTPRQLYHNEALYLYTKELSNAYDAISQKASLRASRQRQPTSSSLARSAETSHGYVPGRGYLMVHKNTGAYRYSPSTNEDTGGVPTSEEVQAFFAERNAARKGVATQPAARNTMSRTITGPMRPREIPLPEAALPSIVEETESTENQEGGRRSNKTRKGRKGRKGRKATRRSN